jgi:hypothetical protein
VQVGGGGEQARAERRHQRRAQGVVQHRRQEAALDHADRVQELIARGEGDLDRPGVRVDRQQLPAEQDPRGGRGRPALHDIPEHAIARHANVHTRLAVRAAAAAASSRLP